MGKVYCNVQLSNPEFDKSMNARWPRTVVLPFVASFNNITATPVTKTKNIRLPWPGSDAFSDTSKFKYATILYYKDGTLLETAYYWVTNAAWKANETLELQLELDAINTLLLSEDLTEYLSQKTLIRRMHKDRFKNWSYDLASLTFTYQYAVDQKSEGFPQAAMVKKVESVITDKAFDYCSIEAAKSCSWAVNYCRESAADTTLRLIMLPFVEGLKFSVNIPNVGWDNYELGSAYKFNFFYTYSTRIIEYPYCPFFEAIVSYSGPTDAYKFEINGENAALFTETSSNLEVFAAEANGIRVDYNDALKNRERYRVIRAFDLSEWAGASKTLPSDGKYWAYRKREILDPKLMHSDFYQLTFSYDAFSYSPKLELMEFASGGTPSFDIQYLVSLNLSSTFAFKFQPNEYVTMIEESDYPQLLICNRNNELALLTDAYLNYVKTSYQFDQQSKMISAASQATGSLLASTVSFATGHPVAGVVAAITGISTMIFNTASAASSIDRSKVSKAAQAMQVVGNDDVDIMRWGTGDKLVFRQYQVRDDIRQRLDDLFYYYGYNHERQGVWSGIATSRVNFNFVQASVIWKPKLVRRHEFAWEMLREKFEEGITFFHWNPDYTIAPRPDYQQIRENWEVSIIKKRI